MKTKTRTLLSLLCSILIFSCSPGELIEPPTSEETPVENEEVPVENEDPTNPANPMDPPVNCQYFFGAWCMEYIEVVEAIDWGNDFFFINGFTGYGVGSRGGLAKTVDGGASWTLLSHPDLPSPITTQYLRTVYFVDDELGYIGGNCCSPTEGQGAIFLKTVDGGLTWEKRYFEEIEQFHDLKFFDDNHGLAITSTAEGTPMLQRYVLQTNDGGLTWSAVDLPLAELRTWRFLTVGNTLKILGENTTGQSIIISSTDEGQSWQTVLLPEPDCHRIHFIDEQFGFATFGKPDFTEYVYETKDGGQTWEMKDYPIRHNSFVHFHDQDNGFAITSHYDYESVSSGVYAVEAGRDFYHTADGGITWDRASAEEGSKFGQRSIYKSDQVIYNYGFKYFNKFEFQ